ncbi:MAG: methylated-DNA--[protein]-cysteine S-methyltransferase [Solirubrobacteraceae bacterium]
MTDEPLFRAIHETPLGPLTLTATARGLTALHFPGRAPMLDVADGAAPALATAREELDAYVAGDLRAFTVPLDPGGTAFQQDVWAMLRTIPYGATTTYGELAARMGYLGGLQRKEALLSLEHAGGPAPGWTLRQTALL